MPPRSAPALVRGGTSVISTGSVRERLPLYGFAAVLAALVLAPLARPGYVLRYDMVFVPRQPLRWDLVAPSGTLPRAVPLDTLVGLANLAVPGWLLQRAVLAGVLVAAAVGAGRLVPAGRRLTPLVAAAGYAWAPFLAERLLLGQWGLLVCYAALPWLVRAARDLRQGRPGATARVVLCAACASVTPTGGIIAFAATAVLGPASERRPGRNAASASAPACSAPARWRAVAAVAALNAPWLVTALTTRAAVESDPAGVAAFAARAENWGGALAALAGTGGIWSAQATPAGRGGAVVPVLTVALLVAAVAGVRRLRERWPEGSAPRLLLFAGAGFVVAALGALPGGGALLRFAVVHVPGAGLLRDGQKFLIPYALCLALCAALGAERAADWFGRRVTLPAGRTVLAGAALFPIAVLPDLAWGAAGALHPVRYPADWATVARAVSAEPGPVVSLPLSAYRSYPWNGGTVALDPAPRYLSSPVLADDRLRVGPVAVAGESREAAVLRSRVAAGRPVADPAVRWVLVQHGVPGAVPGSALAGLDVVHDGPDLTLYRNPLFRASPAPWHLPALAGYLIAAAVLAAAGTSRLRSQPAPAAGSLPEEEIP